MRNRLACCDRVTDNSADQLGQIRLAIEEVCVLHQLFRPKLETDCIGSDDGTGRQRALRYKDLGTVGFDLRRGVGLWSRGSCEHAAGNKRSADRNDQRTNQQYQLLPIHGY